MEVTDNDRRMRFDWRRVFGIAFGLGTHVLFGFTVWHLFFFLADGGTNSGASLLWDVLLALQFSVVHSSLLHPSVRKRLKSWIPSAFYGCFFCAVTCVSLLTIIHFWQTGGGFRWEAGGWTAVAIRCGFYASWAGLFYSLWLSGLGFQTGWTPWWHWLRRLPPPRREFREQGAYRVFRHPIYLSFLGLIWFTPHVTADRLLLIGLWTAYIGVGSYLKDERLAYFVGARYREYQERVPGYPLIAFGPLGRRTPRQPALPVDTDDGQPAPIPHRRAA
jgi:protein-S-isoprenylcysteine O-methyltransferase Ste14